MGHFDRMMSYLPKIYDSFIIEMVDDVECFFKFLQDNSFEVIEYQRDFTISILPINLSEYSKIYVYVRISKDTVVMLECNYYFKSTDGKPFSKLWWLVTCSCCLDEDDPIENLMFNDFTDVYFPDIKIPDPVAEGPYSVVYDRNWKQYVDFDTAMECLIRLRETCYTT